MTLPILASNVKPWHIVPLIFFLLCYHASSSQNATRGEVIYDQAVLHFNAGEIDKGLAQLDSALYYFRKAEAWKLLVFAANDKVMARQYLGATPPEVIRDLLFIVDSLLPRLDTIGAPQAKTYFNLGNTYNHLGLNGLAETYLKRAESIFLTTPEKERRPRQMAYIYGNLGLLCDKMGRFEQALAYSRMAINLLDSIHGYRSKETIHQRGNQLFRLADMGDMAGAQAAWNELELMMEEFRQDAVATPALLFFEANWRWRIGEYQRVLDLTARIFEEYPNYAKQPDFNYKIIELKASCLEKMGRFDEAIRLLSGQGEIQISSSAKLLMQSKLAEVLLSAGKPEQALALAKPGLDPLLRTDSVSAPIPQEWYGVVEALIPLEIATRAQHQIAKRSDSEADWKKLHDIVHEAQATYEDVVFRSNAGDLMELRKRGWSHIYESGVTAAYHLYSINEDPKYLNSAWQFMEDAKSAALVSSVNRTHPNILQAIPAELIDAEQDLKARLTFVQQQIAEFGGGSELIKQNLYVHQALDSLEGIYKERYPEYIAQRFHPKNATIEEALQHASANDLAIVSYLSGAENTYAIMMDRGKIHFWKIGYSEVLNRSIQKFRRQVNKRPELNGFTSAIEQLHHAADSLSRVLLEAYWSTTAPRTSRLLIIPDGMLHYIPFEALRWSEKKSYLVEHADISYTNSLTYSLQNIPHLRENAQPLLAIAPEFGGVLNKNKAPTQGWPHLEGALEEVKQIGAYFQNPEIRTATENYDWFITNKNSYHVIHLATHAFVNESDAFNSGILLDGGQQAGQKGVLKVGDLYQLSIPAELVVLSACDTGEGELSRGEGVVSLAHGFAHAGSPSIIMSLWPANDVSAQFIVTHFYEYLHSGSSMCDALSTAKRTFLSKADAFQSHPYFWSNLLLVGRDAPLTQFSQSNSAMWIWIAGLLSALVLLIVVLFGKRITGLGHGPRAATD